MLGPPITLDTLPISALQTLLEHIDPEYGSRDVTSCLERPDLDSFIWIALGWGPHDPLQVCLCLKILLCFEMFGSCVCVIMKSYAFYILLQVINCDYIYWVSIMYYNLSHLILCCYALFYLFH